MKVEQVPASYRVAFMGLLALGLIALAAVAGMITGNLFRGPEPTPDANRAPDSPVFVTWDKPGAFAAFFKGWEKPGAVLVLSGQMHGYLLPCGCSEHQKGGLSRRYNFIQMLKAQGWPVVALDLGDVAQDRAPHNLPALQTTIKYVTAMKALKLMNYAAVGIGENERKVPLQVALDAYSLNEPQPPVLAANITNKDSQFPLEIGDWVLATPEGDKLKIGVTGFIGPTSAKNPRIQGKEKIDGDLTALKKILQDKVSRDADLRVLLFDGSVKEASTIAAMYPNIFQVILCSDDQDEPPAEPTNIGGTMIITVGHKGKWIAAVGIFPGTKEKYRLLPKMVEMTEDLATPKDKLASDPIMSLMEKYTQDLKKDDYLNKYPELQHPLQASLPTTTYADSDTCRGCHAHAFKVWKESPHSHAYQTLENAWKTDAKQPRNREFDPECVVCHVTGFGYKTGFRDITKTPNLKDVGCEACHGPCMDHVQDPKNAKLYPLINPWKAAPGETPADQKARELKINQFCMGCHDSENDLHWDFTARWSRIIHHTPPKPEKPPMPAAGK